MGKIYGHKAPEVQYCSGFTDQHGHWNNGFLCPLHEEDGEIKYCCGTVHHKYCCVQSAQEQETEQPGFYTDSESVVPDIPLLTGVVVAVSVLLTVSVLLVCYFCKYCPLHKRRKRNQAYSIYEGDGTAYCNEFVVLPGRKFFPAVIGADYKESTPNRQFPTNMASTSTEGQQSSNQMQTLSCPQKDMYRDSGYYPSVVDADSMTCLTENLTLKRARERQQRRANDVTRHSWPGDNEDIHEERYLAPKCCSEERDTGNRKYLEEGEEETDLLGVKHTVV